MRREYKKNLILGVINALNKKENKKKQNKTNSALSD